MFLSSNGPVMKTPSSLPDLSLNISLPDSACSGTDFTHENSALFRLGFEAGDRTSTRLRRNLHSRREFKRSSGGGGGGMGGCGGVRRSIRAPRMRWTTTLHAHFVHAVELLGGHESKTKHTQNPNNPKYLFIIFIVTSKEFSWGKKKKWNPLVINQCSFSHSSQGQRQNQYWSSWMSRILP